jgi:hypothetical protein
MTDFMGPDHLTRLTLRGMAARPPSILAVFLIAVTVWIGIVLSAIEVLAASHIPRQPASWSLLAPIAAIVLAVVGVVLLEQAARFVRRQPTFAVLQKPPAYGLPASLLPKQYSVPNICAGCGGDPAGMQKIYGSWQSGNTHTTLTMSVPFCASCGALGKWIGINRIRVMMFAGLGVAVIEALWQRGWGVATAAVAVAFVVAMVLFVRVWFRQRHCAPVTVGGQGYFRINCREFVRQTAEMNRLPGGLVDLGPT